MVLIHSLINSLISSIGEAFPGGAETPELVILDRFGSVINDRNGDPITTR